MEVTVNSGQTTVITGKKTTNTTTTAKATKDSTTSIKLQNNVNEGMEVKATGKGSVKLDIEAGKFKKSTFDGGNKKSTHSMTVGSSAVLNKSELNFGKGSHTFKLTSGAKLKKNTILDLGNRGKDEVTIGKDIVSGKGG